MVLMEPILSQFAQKKCSIFFGEVVDKKMILNSVGVLAEEYWIEILKQFPYVEFGNFQIMPNHMHGN